jgi:hypothetical protein
MTLKIGQKHLKIIFGKIVIDNLFSKNIREGEEITKESLYSHRRLDQYLPIDIWISYGDLEYENSNHTSKKLLDVSFLGQSQIIETSGQPIIESYTFIARNFV